MIKTVLIIGGAGFIGSHLADELIARGYEVRVFDNLIPQVHGQRRAWPDYLTPRAEFTSGDVRDPSQMRRALDGVDAVFHLAAMVGVGQSMYQVTDYVAVNDLGTAVLLQALIERPVERLVVASSMSIYGEGLYRARDGQIVERCSRTAAEIGPGQWDLRDESGSPLTPVPTPESKRPELASVYALSKYVQERMSLMIGAAYDIPTTALRFFNVYGTRQALSNPYTGVLAIFASRLLNNRRPTVFEDGHQRRDFVHVSDVAHGCRLAMESPGTAGQVFNIGSGRSISIAEVGTRLAHVMDKPALGPEVTNRYRVGDIRHCFADISHARERIGYEPRIDFDQGLAELVSWLKLQEAEDGTERAAEELVRRRLMA
jgi:dTDP-L-rhamnose 4-epimerase